MNKYILIIHDQYLSFKAFAAGNTDTQGKQHREINKSEKLKVKVKSENVLEPPAEKKESIIKTDNSEEKESESTQKLRETTQLNKTLFHSK